MFQNVTLSFFLKTLFLLKYFVVLFSMKFYNIKTLYVSPDTEQRNVELLTEVDDVVCNFRRISHVLKDMHQESLFSLHFSPILEKIVLDLFTSCSMRTPRVPHSCLKFQEVLEKALFLFSKMISRKLSCLTFHLLLMT